MTKVKGFLPQSHRQRQRQTDRTKTRCPEIHSGGFHSGGIKAGKLPTHMPMDCLLLTEWAARGLHMGNLSCKLGCPLLPNMETVGCPLFSYRKGSINTILNTKIENYKKRFLLRCMHH